MKSPTHIRKDSDPSSLTNKLYNGLEWVGKGAGTFISHYGDAGAILAANVFGESLWIPEYFRITAYMLGGGREFSTVKKWAKANGCSEGKAIVYGVIGAGIRTFRNITLDVDPTLAVYQDYLAASFAEIGRLGFRQFIRQNYVDSKKDD